MKKLIFVTVLVLALLGCEAAAAPRPTLEVRDLSSRMDELSSRLMRDVALRQYGLPYGCGGWLHGINDLASDNMIVEQAHQFARAVRSYGADFCQLPLFIEQILPYYVGPCNNPHYPTEPWLVSSLFQDFHHDMASGTISVEQLPMTDGEGFFCRVRGVRSRLNPDVVIDISLGEEP